MARNPDKLVGLPVEVNLIRFDAGHFWYRSGGKWHRLPFIATPALITAFGFGHYLLIVAGPRWLAFAAVLLLLAPYGVLFGLLIWYGLRSHLQRKP